MEQNKQPLLSICIPTYNRAEILKRTLTQIISDKYFDDDVEIIISDNASTDCTQQICQEFCKKYPNIFYYRNPINVNDSNFFLALSKGRGKYVKLNNDTILIQPGALKDLKDKIKLASSNENLFFFQNNEFNSNKTIKFNSINKFINNTNYYITWIANFGCWRDSLTQIVSPQRYSRLKLNQVDWFLQLVSQTNTGTIHFSNYYQTAQFVQKGGYNIYDVFINNFLYIIKQYNIKGITLEIQKYRLLRYFITPWRIKIKRNSSQYTFNNANEYKIILKNFWYYPYTYILIAISCLKK